MLETPVCMCAEQEQQRLAVSVRVLTISSQRYRDSKKADLESMLDSSRLGAGTAHIFHGTFIIVCGLQLIIVSLRLYSYKHV